MNTRSNTRKAAKRQNKQAPARSKPAARKTAVKAARPTAARKPVSKKTPVKQKAAATKKISAKKKVPMKKTAPVKRGAAANKRVSRPKQTAPATRKALSSESAQKKVVTTRPTGALSMPVMASGELAFGTSTVEKESSRKGWFRRFFGITRRKPRLLWIGDALVPTGFATVTHAVLNHLRHDWDVVVSGVNYDGSEHKLPYPVMPAWQGGDMWGLNRFAHLCAEFDPAAVVINNDWWNVAQFAKIAPKGVPIIGYMPVDGGNLDPASMRELNKLHAAVWYTNFGHREAVKAGFKGKRHVVAHGIDTAMFQPMNRAEARRLLDLNVPRNAFIVGNLNRNQPRKRLDLSIHIFADWIKQHRVSNAFLLLHCAQKDTGWDLRRVAAFHGIADRLLLTGCEDIRDLQSPRHLQRIYSSLDVQMTTTLGEGWGLTTMEGMACGIPQIVPDSSALAEWAVPAVKIPCSRLLINPDINTTGALVDHAPFVAALQSLYTDKVLRSRLSAQGMEHVRRGEFKWRNIAQQFHAILAPAISKKSAKRPQHA